MKRLIDIVKRLRAPNGCPWDRKQTHESLCHYILEEAWEVIDEIKRGNLNSSLKEELGDLLLQIVLHSRIAEEENRFDIEDVVESISRKMIDRHPHVFASKKTPKSETELRHQWESIKKREKGTNSIFEGIPTHAPALLNSLTISKRAAGLGFDWKTPGDVLLKIEEELEEVKREMEVNNVPGIEEEIGDLLFTITNLARFYGLDPEITLKKGNDKFMNRFATVEKAIKEGQKSGRNISLEEMHKHWNRSKQSIADSGID